MISNVNPLCYFVVNLTKVNKGVSEINEKDLRYWRDGL